MKIKKGQMFKHPNWIDKEGRPSLVKVTAVRQGRVYYAIQNDAGDFGKKADYHASEGDARNTWESMGG